MSKQYKVTVRLSESQDSALDALARRIGCKSTAVRAGMKLLSVVLAEQDSGNKTIITGINKTITIRMKESK